jgi:hypothetical protein
VQKPPSAHEAKFNGCAANPVTFGMTSFMDTKSWHDLFARVWRYS